MRTNLKLNINEKIQEVFLLILVVISFVIIAKGVYNQGKNINQDNLLVPSICIIYGLISLVFSINGFTKKRLILKWTPSFVIKPLIFIARTHNNKDADSLACKILASLYLINSIVFFYFAIHYMIR